MTIETLQQRVDNAKTTIDKKTKTIEKKKKWIEKAQAKLAQTSDEDEQWDLNYDINSYTEDIKYLERELEAANNKYKKYKEQLDIELNKEKAPKIKVLMDFLEDWKQHAFNYYKDLCIDYHNALTKYYDEYYKILGGKKCCYSMNEIHEHDKELKKLYDPRKHYSAMVKSLYSQYENNYCHEDELIKILDKEVKAKYEDLVNRITKYTGPIQDCSNLSVSAKGDLNGYVVGDNGAAHVETIGAGGYNMDQIVNVKHGQVFHYRTLIHPIKEA